MDTCQAAVVAEWLRRWTWNPMGSSRAGSNPADCGFIFLKKFGCVKNKTELYAIISIDHYSSRIKGRIILSKLELWIMYLLITIIGNNKIITYNYKRIRLSLGYPKIVVHFVTKLKFFLSIFQVERSSPRGETQLENTVLAVEHQKHIRLENPESKCRQFANRLTYHTLFGTVRINWIIEALSLKTISVLRKAKWSLRSIYYRGFVPEDHICP